MGVRETLAQIAHQERVLKFSYFDEEVSWARRSLAHRPTISSGRGERSMLCKDSTDRFTPWAKKCFRRTPHSKRHRERRPSDISSSCDKFRPQNG